MSQVDTNPDRTLEEAKAELQKQYGSSNPFEQYQAAGIERTLRDFSAVPFVRRILFPFEAPVALDPEDPSGRRVMTHKMEYRTADNAAYAYPRVMPDETGQLRDYGADAFNEALRRRDFIKFNTPEQADQFTRLYKGYWDQIGYQPQVRP